MPCQWVWLAQPVNWYAYNLSSSISYLNLSTGMVTSTCQLVTWTCQLVWLPQPVNWLPQSTCPLVISPCQLVRLLQPVNWLPEPVNWLPEPVNWLPEPVNWYGYLNLSTGMVTSTCQLVWLPQPVNWYGYLSLKTGLVTSACQLVWLPQLVNWCAYLRARFRLLFLDVQETCRVYLGDGLDNSMCCHTETEVPHQTCCLIQSHYTNTRPASPSTDAVTQSTWRVAIIEPIFTSLVMTWPGPVCTTR